jgi:NAD+ synthase
MTTRFRVTLAQLNPTVGDLEGNVAKAVAAHQRGREAGADLVALPEMFLTGYQIQDLVLKPAFLRDCMHWIEKLAAETAEGPALGIGGPIETAERVGKGGGDDGGGVGVHNAWFVLEGGEIRATVRKHHLPNVGVFDEKRIYERGPLTGPASIGGVRIGCPICEDAWYPDVVETHEESGAEIVLVPNGSPYARGKLDLRMHHMVARVVETGLPLVYLNMVGAQDDQVFDGGTFVLNPGGGLAVQMPMFDEAYADVDFVLGPEGWRCEDGMKARVPDEWEQDYRAMVEGVRDYARKTGFKTAVLGLSGGVDSALAAAVAADALGPENVTCVMLPSRYTSEESLRDAADVAKALGARLDTISIRGAVEAVGEGLATLFEGLAPDLAEENIQSRLRAVYLMALSNKFGHLLLTTGNKSEVAVGYATLYGDMAGGYNPLKDLYKMRVFESCRWRNANHRPWMKGPEGVMIPPNVIDKPPTAELRADQKDEDSLPPYKDLDVMLEMLMEKDASVEKIVAMGYDRATVKKIEHLVYVAEYKRHQSAPGPKLTQKAFWLDRRYPIANRWRDPS